MEGACSDQTDLKGGRGGRGGGTKKVRHTEKVARPRPPPDRIRTLRASACLVSGHVAYEIVRTLKGGSQGGGSWAVLTGASAVSILAFSIRLGGSPWSDWLTGYPHYVALAVAGSWLAGQAAEFTVAFVFTLFVMYPLRVAHRRGLVKYDINSPSISITHSVFYGVVRATSAALTDYAGVPLTISRQFVFYIATLETVGMIAFDNRGSYAFPARSHDFLVYSSLKSCVFLALPYAEELILSTKPKWA